MCTVNYCACPVGIISVSLYPVGFSIQTRGFPSAAKSVEMSLVACQYYWQRPCKTRWIQWSKPPVNLQFPSLTPVDCLWCKTERWHSTCLTSTTCCLSAAVMQLAPSSNFHSVLWISINCEWLLWLGMWAFHYSHISIIGERLRALYDSRDIFRSGSVQNKNQMEGADARFITREFLRF